MQDKERKKLDASNEVKIEEQLDCTFVCNIDDFGLHKKYGQNIIISSKAWDVNGNILPNSIGVYRCNEKSEYLSPEELDTKLEIIKNGLFSNCIDIEIKEVKNSYRKLLSMVNKGE